MQTRDLASAVQVVTAALETVGKIASGATVDTALAALHGVVAIVEAARKGVTGEVTSKEALDHLAMLHKQLVAHDDEADAALHNRFG